MFSIRELAEVRRATPKKVRVAVGVALLATTLIGLYAYLAPTSGAAGAAIDDAPAMANNPTIPPWSDYLSNEAVESRGIEKDLDGNGSALVASPLP